MTQLPNRLLKMSDDHAFHSPDIVLQKGGLHACSVPTGA